MQISTTLQKSSTDFTLNGSSTDVTLALPANASAVSADALGVESPLTGFSIGFGFLLLLTY